MEEQIKRVTVQLKRAFMTLWLLAIIGVIVGETGGDWIGIYADLFRVTYFAETGVILLTAICVPISLKLFAWVLVRKIDQVSFLEALRLYAIWSIVRIVLLLLPVIAGLLVYYLTLSNTGVLCALIALTASLFCLPSEARLRKELHIDKEQEG